MRKSIILVCAAFVLASCIRDEIEPCPPLRVTLAIGDRNYDNIGEVVDAGFDVRRGDDEPFSSFVTTLTYVVRNIDTREVVAERQLHDVTGDALGVAVEGLAADLPFGNYAVTAWGNIQPDDALSSDCDVQTLPLHQGEAEGGDVYMACDTLAFTAERGDFTVNLHRVKGKLIVDVVNLPAEVSWSDKTITGIAGSVDTRFGYAGTASVKTLGEWQMASSVTTSTLVAPAVAGDAATVDINFYDDASRTTPTCEPELLRLPLDRNHITVVRMDYDAELGAFTAFVLVDSKWEDIHDLELD